MTPVVTLFLFAASAALLLLPRRWAPLPLLMGACYMTLGQGISIGSFSFPFIRLLMLVGFIRVILRGERPAGGFSVMDTLMCVWAAWAVFSSAFHADAAATLENHLGMVYNNLGLYFLIRCFCQSLDDVVVLIKTSAIILVPVALEMLNEQLTQSNLFARFGALPEETIVRSGRIRAQGPFAHPILAGTVGAVSAPLMLGIWRRHPGFAKMGLAACVLMVLASASSGPLMSLVFGGFALILWRWRHLTRQMRVAAVVGYILLEVTMNAPAYYLMARIDLTGSSTSWHRAALIQAGFEHLGDWWFAGTDYTRDWMPYGVPWSENHADITNHYLAQGVKGGLPLMLLFIFILWCGFRGVGQALRSRKEAPVEDQFLIWALGASLFAHAATCISAAYYDQSFLFLYSALAMIVSMRAAPESEVTASFTDLRPENQPAIANTNPGMGAVIKENPLLSGQQAACELRY
jgi:hypothetical protein